jgi:cyclopropane-fatty-acyl-phospholipid synthase
MRIRARAPQLANTTPEDLMSSSIATGSFATHGSTARYVQRIAARLVRARLAALREGDLTLAELGDAASFGQVADPAGLRASVRVHDPRFWTTVALGGSAGAGAAYMKGYWSTDDLTTVLRLMLRNRAALEQIDGGLARLLAPVNRLRHWLRRNSVTGARRNIEAHYDLGNDFFALMLDPTLMYSCALFERADMTLEEAQYARLQRLCAKLRLTPDDHLLEIGTGWGSFAIYAAQHYGCRVTTTTISARQYACAHERIQAAGLGDRITLLKKDYRELDGQFDKLVSIEMIEAVGAGFYDEYFARCARLLKDDGVMLLQAITIADQRYEEARRSVDFIQKFIFPGSTIPSVTAMLASMTRASDLRLTHLEDIGAHYVTTLSRWRRNFLQRLPDVIGLGYSQSFARLWEFYLCYCEAGFAERALGDVQMLLTKPGNRHQPLLGRLHHDAQ